MIVVILHCSSDFYNFCQRWPTEISKSSIFLLRNS